MEPRGPRRGRELVPQRGCSPGPRVLRPSRRHQPSSFPQERPQVWRSSEDRGSSGVGLVEPEPTGEVRAAGRSRREARQRSTAPRGATRVAGCRPRDGVRRRRDRGASTGRPRCDCAPATRTLDASRLPRGPTTPDQRAVTSRRPAS